MLLPPRLVRALFLSFAGAAFGGRGDLGWLLGVGEAGVEGGEVSCVKGLRKDKERKKWAPPLCVKKIDIWAAEGLPGECANASLACFFSFACRLDTIPSARYRYYDGICTSISPLLACALIEGGALLSSPAPTDM